MEEWRPVAGSNRFEVSSLGRVRSAGRLLRSSPVKGKPYRQVRVDRGPRMIHLLVLEAFVGPRPPGQQTRHLNGRGDDNRLENLRWGTAAENRADAQRHGTVAVGLQVKPTCRRGHPRTPGNVRTWLNPRTGYVHRYCIPCEELRKNLDKTGKKN